jgi:hypothetical protein
MLKIEKNTRREQSRLYGGIAGYSHPIASSVLISLSDDCCDDAPLCDVYGKFDAQEAEFDVHAITISGTRTNITSLFSSSQLSQIGTLMAKNSDVFAEID